jgi:hypothetical protein
MSSKKNIKQKSKSKSDSESNDSESELDSDSELITESDLDLQSDNEFENDSELSETESIENKKKDKVHNDRNADKDIDIENDENIEDDIENDIFDDDYEEQVYDDDEEVNDKNITDSELIDGENDDLENCFYKYDNIVYEYEDDKAPLCIAKDKRITPKKMTKYEIVRVLGIRAKQISVGAKVLIKNIQGETPLEIAIHELLNKMTPFIIKRPLPNNTYELWKINELDIKLNFNDIKNIISF